MSKIQKEPQLQMGTAYIPGQTGMYDPQFEKDSCGVGFIVDLKAKHPDVQFVSNLDLEKWLEAQDPAVLQQLQALPPATQ